MKFYKYRSLENLWFTLDIIYMQRLYCASWTELNDPLEGSFEIFAKSKTRAAQETMFSRVDEARNTFRIASVSASPTNFLMWSHYANGHKGIAIEIEIDDSNTDFTPVVYSPFTTIFGSKSETKEDLRHIFQNKSDAWAYEEEYRVIIENRFYNFVQPVQRILVGPMVEEGQLKLLKEAVPERIEFIQMELDANRAEIVPENRDICFDSRPVQRQFLGET